MKLIVSLIFLLVFCCNSKAQELNIKKNTVLHYKVETDNSKKYTFDVTVDKFGAAGIKFNWQMVFDKDSSKGVVTIYKAALETAVAYRNYFGNNTNVKLTKESTVWMSKKNYKDLVDKTESELSLDFNIQKYKWEKDVNYSTKILGKSTALKAFQVKSTTTTNYLQILKTETNPLSVKMKTKDFTISLTHVEQK